ncbi:glycosyltransferase family 4 protein [Synechococcus elongatus]|uniref:Glycosyltransferase family 4 protein n=1 Tax=Synechococcus elongatus PCC 11802 TaxID=2283154 RepID=A0AAT9JYP3_SYNEL|nr:glycosyltransferase family 4 protein [Synechococcus elongatus]QFZ91316.1 glycosyltransferase WbuB [Synechococcus elongatus PCC 11802]
MNVPPRLLLVNQTVGPLFRDLLAAASQQGTVTLLAGSSSVTLPAGVHWNKGIRYRRQSAAQRLLTWLGFSLQLSVYLLWKGHSYDRLLIVSNPPLAPLLAPWARRSYVLLLYDLYPQVLQQLTPTQQRGWRSQGLQCLTALWQAVNRRVFAQAAAVYTLSPGMAEALKESFPSLQVWRDRVKVIPPWVDPQLQPLSASETSFRATHQLQATFLLLYSGNLGLTHPLEPLIQAAEQLQGYDFQLLFIGQGAKRSSLEKNVQQQRLSNVRFLDPLPYADLNQSYSAANLAVVCLDGPAAKASLPSKTFTALALGTPILAIAPLDSDLAQLIQNQGCGWVIAPNAQAPEAIAALIKKLIDQPQLLLTAKTKAQVAAADYTVKNAQYLVNDWLSRS